MEQLQALKTKKQHKTKQNLQRFTHACKFKRKASTNLLNSFYASFLFADFNSSDLLATSHTSHRTASIVTSQTNSHVAVDDSNRNQQARPATANQQNFAYLKFYKFAYLCPT